MTRAVTILVVLLLGAVAVVVLGEEIHRHLSDLERRVRELGAWGPIVLIVAFVVLTSLFVPDTVMGIASGVLFGLAGGTAVVAVGGLIACSVQWALGRGVLKARVERMLDRRPPLAAIRRAVHQDELRLQVLIRLTPLSPALVSYLMGAAGVRFGGFVLACLALLPGFFLEVYVGYAGRHMASMAGRPAASVVVDDVAIVGGLAACAAVMVLITRTARRALRAAAEPVAIDSAASRR